MSYDLWSGIGGSLLRTHGSDQCAGNYCCIHNPSPHHMRDFPLNWRGDRGLMERICPHGIGHPDPDDIAFKHRANGAHYAEAASIHGCDMCCQGTVQDFQPRWHEVAWWSLLAFLEWIKSFFRR